MTVLIPSSLYLFEAVACIQIAQALKADIYQEDMRHDELFLLAGLKDHDDKADDDIRLQTDKAFRAVEAGDEGYPQVLARESGWSDLRLNYPKFPTIKASEEGGIVVCPYALRTGLEIQVKAWIEIVNLLRTYGHSVVLVADPGFRMDMANFSEADLLCNRPMKDKLEALAAAKLIVGVPNGYLWAATGWQKRMIYCYPDGIPPRRWMPFVHDTFGRIQYEARDLSLPVLIAGIRKLISVL